MVTQHCLGRTARWARIQSRRQVLVRAKTPAFDVQKLQMRAVESAVGVVNRILSSVSKEEPLMASNQLPVAQDEAMSLDLADRTDLVLDEGVWIKFSASNSFYRPVTEVPGRDVQAYLALPPAEYNLLEGEYVEYLGANQFRVQFPFKESFGLDLAPEIVLEVQPDEATERVTFVSTSILSGREDIDQVTDISFASILSREETGSGKDGPEEVFLVSVMQFKAALKLNSRAAKKIPKAVLEKLGSQLMNAVLKASLEPYMKGLEEDYYLWANKNDRAGVVIEAAVMPIALK